MPLNLGIQPVRIFFQHWMHFYKKITYVAIIGQFSFLCCFYFTLPLIFHELTIKITYLDEQISLTFCFYFLHKIHRFWPKMSVAESWKLWMFFYPLTNIFSIFAVILIAFIISLCLRRQTVLTQVEIYQLWMPLHFFIWSFNVIYHTAA